MEKSSYFQVVTTNSQNTTDSSELSSALHYLRTVYRGHLTSWKLLTLKESFIIARDLPHRLN